ncbi:MAG TPA: hypothetical protein P5240_00835 [Syntrophorhabdaceae bacterium]|nr:hypothetical protein [Syntrophorhabdaceae bacterium]
MFAYNRATINNRATTRVAPTRNMTNIFTKNNTPAVGAGLVPAQNMTIQQNNTSAGAGLVPAQNMTHVSVQNNNAQQNRALQQSSPGGVL